MAEKLRYTCQEPSRLLFSSVTQKSAPRTVQNATPKFSATVGIGQKDLDAIIPLMVQCIQSETGGFTGNPEDYYLACMSGKTAAARVRAKAELDCMGKNADDAFKIKEKAEKRAAVYETFPGILQASSQFDVELARLDGGKIVDIKEEHQRAQAGKDLFYSGAYVVPAVSFQGFRRKSLDAKDGVTGFLQNMLFIRKGEKLDLGGGGANNQDVFGGFANYSDYDPTAMAPGGGNEFAGFASGGQAGNGANAGASSPPNAPSGASPSSPPADPNRPEDPAWRHDNGNGTEQWYNGSAWDGGTHPIPAAAPPPPAGLNPPPAPGAAMGGGQPAW
jgi:hypothetical protein